MTKDNIKTDRTKYIDYGVLASAPTGGSICDLKFFKLDKYVSDEELKNEYASRGLTPVTVDVFFEYDKINRKKLDEMKYVATHWKDKDSKWCYAAFNRWRDDERNVHVDRHGNDWDDDWWFVGVASSTKSYDLDSIHLEPTSLDLAIETVKKAGYTVIKTTKWYITGRGQVIETGPNDKTDERGKFLGAYDTKEQAEHARDQVRLMFGDKYYD